jgi:hypothetical protein
MRNAPPELIAIERELARYETAGGFEGPCELLVAAGTAPA